MKSVVISVVDEPSIDGGGHARLIVTGMGRAHRPELTFKIKRQSDVDASLGPSGWQSGDHLFTAHEVSVEGEDLLLLAGPEVCAHIDDYTAIEVIIPDLAVNGLLVWEGVTPPFEYKPAEPPPEPEPAPAPLVEEPQEIAVTAGNAAFESDADGLIHITGTLERGDTREDFEKRLNPGEEFDGVSYDLLKEADQGQLRLDVTENAWVIEKSTPPPPPPQPKEKRKSSNLWIILVLLLVIGIGAAGYLLWSGMEMKLRLLPQAHPRHRPPPARNRLASGLLRHLSILRQPAVAQTKARRLNPTIAHAIYCAAGSTRDME